MADLTAPVHSEEALDYPAWWLSRAAIHLEKASEFLELWQQAVQYEASLRPIVSDQSDARPSVPDQTKAKSLRVWAVEGLQRPLSVLFLPLVDSLKSGKPELSNREGIDPVASTPAVVG